MGNEVFEANKVIVFTVIGLINAGVVVVVISLELSLWIILAALIVSALIGISTVKTKLIIADGKLRYEKWGGVDEVDLAKVAEISTREIETFERKSSSNTNNSNTKQGFGITINSGNTGETERKVSKVTYVLDENGRTFFTFPGGTISFRNRTRFRDAIHAVNPNIEVF